MFQWVFTIKVFFRSPLRHPSRVLDFLFSDSLNVFINSVDVFCEALRMFFLQNGDCAYLPYTSSTSSGEGQPWLRLSVRTTPYTCCRQWVTKCNLQQHHEPEARTHQQTENRYLSTQLQQSDHVLGPLSNDIILARYAMVTTSAGAEVNKTSVEVESSYQFSILSGFKFTGQMHLHKFNFLVYKKYVA